MNVSRDLLAGYLTRDQLASQLGVTVRTLGRWMAQPNGLPYTTLGARTLFRIDAVKEWIASRERRPNPRRRSA